MNHLSESDRTSVQQRAVSLIRPLIPLDAEKAVNATVKEYNQLVRGHIREETGLGSLRASVPIHIVDGFPDSVTNLINRHEDLVLWRLIMLQPKLGGVVEGLEGLLQSWDEF